MGLLRSRRVVGGRCMVWCRGVVTIGRGRTVAVASRGGAIGGHWGRAVPVRSWVAIGGCLVAIGPRCGVAIGGW